MPYRTTQYSIDFFDQQRYASKKATIQQTITIFQKRKLQQTTVETMSTKLLKRLLQNTLELHDETTTTTTTTTKQTKNKKQRKRDDETRSNTTTNIVDPLQEKVNTILLWDKTFQSNNATTSSLKRKLKEQKKGRKTAIVSSNSRSSSAKRQKIQPTITKKILSEKQKLKTVQELAEALRKTSRKNKKSSK